MPGATADGRSFPVHGGRCTGHADAGELRVDQSAFRHLHVAHVLFSTALLGLAAYGAATGWRYARPTPSEHSTPSRPRACVSTADRGPPTC